MVPSTPHPPSDPWTVAIHRSATDQSPLGSGVVIDSARVLTCAHVVRQEGQWRDEIWVAFPKAAGVSWGARRRVELCLADGLARNIDLTVLVLAEPVPGQVTPARLRCLPAPDLYGRRWWAFGFPGGAEHGSDANGTVGTPLAYGQVRLDTTSSYKVEQGFSGSGLWSPDYEAVVGLLVSVAQDDTHRGDGLALTLYHIDQELPELKLSASAAWSPEAADEGALAAWGWALRHDPEAGRHWLPRSRGVAAESERGYRFRGRTAALTEVVRWLDRSTIDSRVLVVTGSPGVGKSAVLGRIVATADAEIRGFLPSDDNAVRAGLGSVACAVHVKGKTALEVAIEIARAASVALPAAPEDLVPALRTRLVDRLSRFNLIVDALDEAVSPRQARLLLRTVVLPLARTCAGVGAQLVVGTRRADGGGDLLGEFAGNAVLIDLDDPRYFDEPDLAAYVSVTLRLVGAERVGNPYADPAVADPVARRIAALAGRNFLVAGLVARAYGLHDTEPVDPDKVSFSATVDAALGTYLAGLTPAGRAPARLALTVLAYAEAPGLPLPLWRAGLIALGSNVSEEQLALFARTSAANFLVETTADPAMRAYRLFHQALNEALLRSRATIASRIEDERRLVEAWLHHGQATGWPGASEYLLRWLPAHAQRVHEVDALLGDDAYLLYVDLRRLIPAADEAGTATGRARARLLQRTPLAVDAEPAQRAAMFSVAQTLDQLDSKFAAVASAPYRGRWACTRPRLERTVLEGHADAVFGVCSVLVGARSLLASAGEDGTVRLWDPTTGQTEGVLVGHTDRIRTVCEVSMDERTLLASAGEDGTVRLWDPGTSHLERVLIEHADWIRGLCAVRVGDTCLLASASDDRTVRLWEPGTGRLIRVLDSPTGWVTAVCPVPHGTRSLLASAGYDASIRIWDLSTGHLERVLDGHSGWVTAVAPLPIGKRSLIASGSYDTTVRVWDATTGRLEQVLHGHTGPVTGVCMVQVGRRVRLASTSEDSTVRLWNPLTGDADMVLDGHTAGARGVCTVPVGRRDLVASASDDGTVRLWAPNTGRPERVIDGGRIGPIVGLCTVPTAEGALLASTSDDGSVRLWEPTTGQPERTMVGHGGAVTGVCVLPVDGGHLLASASEDGTVRLWNMDRRQTERIIKGHDGSVTALCPVQADGRHLLASASVDRTVRLWNPTNGKIERILDHTDWVTAVCAVPVEGHDLLASAGDDGTVRLWDPTSGVPTWTVHGHHATVTAICDVPVGGRQLLASASEDRTVWLWDPATGAPVWTGQSHTARVTGLCAVSLTEGSLLVSTSEDRTARLWDPVTGTVVQSIPVHHRALACWYMSGTLVLGLDTGILAVTLDT